MGNLHIEGAMEAGLLREMSYEQMPTMSGGRTWQQDMHRKGWQFYETVFPPNRRLSDMSQEQEIVVQHEAVVLQMPSRVVEEQVRVA